MFKWQCASFDELSTHQLYAVLQARVNVFVVEQNCPYPELDDKDLHPETRHLIGYRNDDIAAYARLLPPGISYPSVSIGRVLTTEKHRGNKLGYQLVEEAINQCTALWPDTAIEIGAQEHLAHFYEKFGFKPTSTMYLDDGIPHIDMKRLV
ncbi:GNAT family N-acetyltransferase [Aestuariibacter sp. A3R04]|uniref:GNAT family N-acetyltransferase n=1 Tax=Aestuariibacter sp. A3R04 TaxID=2841571 RepID=UPI001C0983EF|nr:GNAT family N-acetyltransferase [Aestuariibacter sp. A3R04]MBU3021088.1 GNAT family N-acetyltransferase [Aestuariibacter sp. A3R04]